LIRSSRIKVQTLIYHGKNDKIISNRGTNKIASLIPNNKFILFDNVYHEPHNDIEKDLVFKEITDFIIK
jgi:alpha-beta hydrolase superfamily lysophospholipase